MKILSPRERRGKDKDKLNLPFLCYWCLCPDPKISGLKSNSGYIFIPGFFSPLQLREDSSLFFLDKNKNKNKKKGLPFLSCLLFSGIAIRFVFKLCTLWIMHHRFDPFPRSDLFWFSYGSIAFFLFFIRNFCVFLFLHANMFFWRIKFVFFFFNLTIPVSWVILTF